MWFYWHVFDNSGSSSSGPGFFPFFSFFLLYFFSFIKGCYNSLRAYVMKLLIPPLGLSIICKCFDTIFICWLRLVPVEFFYGCKMPSWIIFHLLNFEQFPFELITFNMLDFLLNLDCKYFPFCIFLLFLFMISTCSNLVLSLFFDLVALSKMHHWVF